MRNSIKHVAATLYVLDGIDPRRLNMKIFEESTLEYGLINHINKLLNLIDIEWDDAEFADNPTIITSITTETHTIYLAIEFKPNLTNIGVVAINSNSGKICREITVDISDPQSFNKLLKYWNESVKGMLDA